MKKFFFKSAKINEFRLWGLVSTMLGMLVMILGTAGIVFWGEAGRIVSAIFLVLGMIVLLASVVIYFWAGMMSTSATALQCPECNKQTKMLGKTDRCMFCKTMLTLDPNDATEFAQEEESHPAPSPTN
ncbi:YgzB family protein [Paenibacillus yanchengensis]|uniref:YgzB family protein n=1 Tax=Paenibacillus yanchengensis TaxID=2035833 RepID=A0ABW4YJ78_9BACL